MSERNKRVQTIISPIDQAEMTVRMLEAAIGVRRPFPSARETLDDMRKNDPESYAMWRKASTAALLYVKECVENGRPIS